MHTKRHGARRPTALAFALALCAATAAAQGLMSTQGVIVATDGDPVRNGSAIPIPGFVFGGSGALGDNCVLDETGNVLFRARFVDSGGSTNAFNDRAYFYGSSRSNVRMLIRGGDQAPGLPAGILLRTAGGNLSPLSSAVRLAPDGRAWWGSYLFDSVGVSTTSSNDECVGGGAFGAQALFVRKGDPAPGTVGAQFVQAFSSPNLQTAGINRAGRCYFLGSLTGGDVSGTANQQGIWSGLPGALELVARKGSPAPTPAFAGEYVADTIAALPSLVQMNDAGKLLYEVALSQTLGSPTATAANDVVVLVHTPGSGSAILAREGATAPGTAGATFNALSGDAWAPGFSPNCFTRNGTTLFSSELRGGSVVPGVDDRALFRGGAGALALACRRSDPAPGTDAQFDDWNTNSLLLDAAGRICFQGRIAGGTATGADDTGIWMGQPGALHLVVREGDTIAGTGGSVAGSLFGAPVFFNDRGQVLFQTTLSGGTTTGIALFAWESAQGIRPIVLPGDQVQIATGVLKTISGFGTVAFNNTNGAALCFGHDGKIGLRVGFSDGTNAIMVASFGASTPSVPYCFGDGSGTACPCGNSGAAGNGCANSVQPGGAQLVGAGLASIGNDTYLLTGSGMPNNAVLYFQGTSRLNGGAGAVLGDGLRCAGGAIVRLGTKTNTAGASHYPASGDATISVRGGIATPATRDYQGWYRNAATFCTPATFNFSNAVEVTWVP